MAATITITAGVPLTVVSKTLRHSTLSTTANLCTHLTQQAAREAVDHTLTGAENAGHETGRTPWLRPPRDHIHRIREALRRHRSPAVPGFSATADRPQTGRATTMAPDARKAALS
ncbi:hypothetical protein [Streptomyces sp. NPDC051109]|uniref:hypothetical protein n=1 Tax=Streptomyces sp. NPDC051109 TaxID=3365642 RepID=UPI00379E8C89